MNTDSAIERIRVIHAPPGSILVFEVGEHLFPHERAHITSELRERLPDYRILVWCGTLDIKAIVPTEAPPVVNNYHGPVAQGGDTQ